MLPEVAEYKRVGSLLPTSATATMICHGPRQNSPRERIPYCVHACPGPGLCVLLQDSTRSKHAQPRTHLPCLPATLWALTEPRLMEGQTDHLRSLRPSARPQPNMHLDPLQLGSGPPPWATWEQPGTSREKCAFREPSHPHKVVLTLGRDIKEKGLGPRPWAYGLGPKHPQPRAEAQSSAWDRLPLPSSSATSAPKWYNRLAKPKISGFILSLKFLS